MKTEPPPTKNGDQKKPLSEASGPHIGQFAIIIGGMLCGSDTLFSLLSQHPQLAACSKVEPHFFSSEENWAKGPEEYYRLWDFDPKVHKHALEATTHYSKDVAHPGVPQRMAELGAEYKIMYLLKHPVDRAEAHLASTVKNENLDLEELQKSFPYAARLSSYATQLDAYREIFPKMEFALLDADELENDPLSILNQCVDFLGLDTQFEFQIPEKSNPQAKPSKKSPTQLLSSTDRQKIAAEVLEDVERLHDEYGFDSSIWYDRDFRKAAWDLDEKRREQKKLVRDVMEAGEKGSSDIFIFPVIDWHFRIQRPQHLATSLADAGHRVFYFMTTFSAWPGHPGYQLVESPHPNVFICKLHCRSPHPRIYSCRQDFEMALDLTQGLDILRRRLLSERSIEIVQHPFWRQVVSNSPGTRVVYDCIDHHAGFSTATDTLVHEENQLLIESDVVVTTSAELSKIISKQRDNTVIRNAAEVEHFAREEQAKVEKNKRPRVGYFGAISSWFDIELVARSARAFPQWDFFLIGGSSDVQLDELEGLKNVHLEGEIQYADLPEHLHSFDVCMIPFIINELIRCTNPVKVYEYLSAGKPVVATAMPELLLLGNLVYVAQTPDEFIAKLAEAMEEREVPELKERRTQWAQRQTWTSRGENFKALITGSMPRVSVIVLCFNHLEMTQACLDSLVRFSHYPNLELILVDNASSDETAEYLAEFQAEHTRPGAVFSDVKVIINDENFGFSGGNNIGIWSSSGEFVILLNNDTFVTHGWVNDLVRHFRLEPELGLVGPVTNMIGNEAQVPMDYQNMDEMAVQARDYTIRRGRSRLAVANLGFFCVALSREVIDQVGLLDEDFKVGFFEDDDYCRRVTRAGFHIAIAEDVFIHHHLSASFGALEQEQRDAIFASNKKVYEDKWGAWEPHQKRSDFEIS